MKLNKISIVLICIFLLATTFGCKQNKPASIPAQNISMKTVQQNSQDGYISCKFSLPENWEAAPIDYFSVGGTESSNLEKNIKMQEALPLVITVKKYAPFMSKDEIELNKMYEDLFAGKPQAYKDYLNHYHNAGDYDEDHVNESVAASVTSHNLQDGENISGFTYKSYQGKHGRIMEVRYTYQYKKSTYHAVNCIREDIPYIVSGGLDSTLKTSSGNIAVWVADSLEVTENYTMKDGSVVKNS